MPREHGFVPVKVLADVEVLGEVEVLLDGAISSVISIA